MMMVIVGLFVKKGSESIRLRPHRFVDRVGGPAEQVVAGLTAREGARAPACGEEIVRPRQVPGRTRAGLAGFDAQAVVFEQGGAARIGEVNFVEFDFALGVF